MNDNTEREELAALVAGVVPGVWKLWCEEGLPSGVYRLRDEARATADRILASDLWRNHQAEELSDEQLLETYRKANEHAMHEANLRDGFGSNMSRESIVAGLRAVAALAAHPVVDDAMVERAARTLDLDAWGMDPYDYLDAYQGRAITTHDGPGFQEAARERARRTARAALLAALTPDGQEKNR